MTMDNIIPLGGKNLMNLYCIYDRLAEVAGPIFEQKNHECAKKAMAVLIIQMDTPFPDDYSLMCLGYHDKETGEIMSHGKPMIIQWSHEYESMLAKIKVTLTNQIPEVSNETKTI